MGAFTWSINNLCYKDKYNNSEKKEIGRISLPIHYYKIQ